MSMSAPALDPVAAVCPSLGAAHDAVARLRAGGFAPDRLSVVGRGGDQPAPPDLEGRVRACGLAGSLWGAVCGLCAGAAMLFLPPLGPVLAAGPIAALLATAVEGAVLGGGVSAIAAALTSLGLAEEDARHCESDVAASRYLIVVHGDAGALAHARAVLAAAKASPSCVPHAVLEDAQCRAGSAGRG